MLEKISKSTNVQKLREILLLEADFNTLHKIVFNSRIIPTLEDAGIIPYEITSGRRIQLAIYLVLNKKLLVDIANIQKRTIVTICADVTNCYNRVIYLFASLCAQYFRLEVSYLLVLFRIT